MVRTDCVCESAGCTKALLISQHDPIQKFPNQKPPQKINIDSIFAKKTFISSILLAKILDTLAFIFIFFLTSKTYLMISCAKNKLGQIKTTAVRRELRGRGE